MLSTQTHRDSQRHLQPGLLTHGRSVMCVCVYLQLLLLNCFLYYIYKRKPNVLLFLLSSSFRDIVYFSDAWIGRIKPEVGDNWRLKVRIIWSYVKGCIV